MSKRTLYGARYSTGAYMAMFVVWLMLVVVLGLSVMAVTISHNLSFERQYNARHTHHTTENK